MNGFERRCAKGAELQQHLLEYLDDAGVQYLLSGYEHLSGSDNARQIITRNSDGVSLFIRHYPDVSVIKPGRSVLIEVKNSSGIERECFNAYLALNQDLNLHLLLFLKNKMLCQIQDLRFSPMPEKDPVAGFDVPVSEGIWREPRQMETEDYHAYLAAYRARKKYTSGCSFAFIDFKRTRFYPLKSIAASLKAAA